MKRDDTYKVQPSENLENDASVAIDIPETQDHKKQESRGELNDLSLRMPPPAYTSSWKPTVSEYKEPIKSRYKMRPNRVPPMQDATGSELCDKVVASLDKLCQRLDRI